MDKTKRNNWNDFKEILDQHHITSLYHFTDRENLESIIKNGGLYSWADCDEKGIKISKQGGGGGGVFAELRQEKYEVLARI